jgi:hypothetical protein
MKRISVDKARMEVRLSFNEGFYDPKSITQAITDYLDVCEVSRVEGNLVLKPKDPKDLDIIGYEFYNYVLGLMKNS